MVAAATSGIAAILLYGGRTSHSRFGIPLVLSTSSTSSVGARSSQGAMLRESDVIIWDEAGMAPKDAVDVVDKLLKSLTGNQLPFGGKIVIFAGDFRHVQ